MAFLLTGKRTIRVLFWMPVVVPPPRGVSTSSSQNLPHTATVVVWSAGIAFLAGLQLLCVTQLTAESTITHAASIGVAVAQVIVGIAAHWRIVIPASGFDKNSTNNTENDDIATTIAVMMVVAAVQSSTSAVAGVLICACEYRCGSSLVWTAITWALSPVDALSVSAYEPRCGSNPPAAAVAWVATVHLLLLCRHICTGSLLVKANPVVVITTTPTTISRRGRKTSRDRGGVYARDVPLRQPQTCLVLH